MSRLKTGGVILGFLLVLPSLAYAQASIAGVVRDASGAVLPGVTVEATSPALIEKVRTWSPMAPDSTDRKPQTRRI